VQVCLSCTHIWISEAYFISHIFVTRHCF
jgi:hypothetical protein